VRLAELLEAPASPAGRDALRRLITRVDLGETELRAEVSFAQIDGADGGGFANLAALELAYFSVAAPLRLRRRGPELRIVLGGAAAPAPTPDPLLVRTLVEARRRLAAYLDPARAPTISDIAHSEGADIGDVSRSLQLAFLAPDLVEGILNGTQPVGLTAERLKRVDLPLLWEDQRAVVV
jgi:site-specific DNA recombinase